MNWFTAAVLYILIWWTVLFAVLPFGTKPVAGPDPHTGWRGAPEHPGLRRKLLLTTGISAVIWLACVGVIESDWISFRHGMLRLPDE